MALQRFPFVLDPSHIDVAALEKLPVNVLHLQGRIETRLDIEQATQILVTGHLGIVAGDSVIRAPQLRQVLDDRVAPLWLALTGTAWKCHLHQESPVEHTALAFLFYEDIADPDGSILPNRFNRDLFKKWKSRWSLFMRPDPPRIHALADHPPHLQKAIDDICEDGTIAASHEILQAVRFNPNSPVQAATTAIRMLRYAPVDEADVPNLVESAQSILGADPHDDRLSTRCYDNIHHQIRDIANLHQPGQCLCEPAECPMLVPVQWAMSRTQLP